MAVQPGTPHCFVRRLEIHDLVSNLLRSIICPLGLALFTFAVLERAFSIHFMYYLVDIPFISFLTKLIICHHSTAGCSDVHTLTQRETRWLPPTTQAIIGTGDMTQHAGTRRKTVYTFQGRSYLYKTNKQKKGGISP